MADWPDILVGHAASELTARRLIAQLRACEAAALAFCRLLERWGRGEAKPPTAGGREAALRHAADRVETALAGLETPLGRYLLELEADQAEGRSWYTGPGAGELVEWRPCSTPRRRSGQSGPRRLGLPRAGRARACAAGTLRRRAARCASGRVVALGGPLRPARHAARLDRGRPQSACRLASPGRRRRRVNLDLVARVERLPRPGETVTGAAFERVPGGKGANQAVACARLGADVTLVCAVGERRVRGRGAAARGEARRPGRPRRGADRCRADPRRLGRREPDRRRARARTRSSAKSSSPRATPCSASSRSRTRPSSPPGSRRPASSA